MSLTERSTASDVSPVLAIAGEPIRRSGTLDARSAGACRGDEAQDCANWMQGCPLKHRRGTSLLDVVLFPSRVATMALGVLGMMGAMLSITGIFGMAAYSVSRRLRELGIRVALGAQRTEVLRAALGRAFKLLAIGSAAGLLLGILATKVLASIVYQATPRDPLVLSGVVLAMALTGAAGDVDSSAAGALCRPSDSAARRVSRPGFSDPEGSRRASRMPDTMPKFQAMRFPQSRLRGLSRA